MLGYRQSGLWMGKMAVASVGGKLDAHRQYIPLYITSKNMLVKKQNIDNVLEQETWSMRLSRE